MARERIQHCFNCGADLGVYASWPGDIETCGKAECEREARYQRQAQEADVQERAAMDDYDRYRY